MGKRVHLTLGCSQLELEQANGGIFLYWHGRLIEAYKRVGGMIHNGDWGRGVIGVIDVSDLMNVGNGRVGVHNTKQSFLDCEPYALLEVWLGRKLDEYWTDNFEKLELKKGGSQYKPDHEWVQCDKCRKWRMLSSGFDIKTLPEEWFCYMDPFHGSCEIPEQKPDCGVITVSAKRTRQDIKDLENDAVVAADGNSEDSSLTEKNDKRGGFKRTRKGLPRTCKKGTCVVPQVVYELHALCTADTIFRCLTPKSTYPFMDRRSGCGESAHQEKCRQSTSLELHVTLRVWRAIPAKSSAERNFKLESPLPGEWQRKIATMIIIAIVKLKFMLHLKEFQTPSLLSAGIDASFLSGVTLCPWREVRKMGVPLPANGYFAALRIKGKEYLIRSRKMLLYHGNFLIAHCSKNCTSIGILSTLCRIDTSS
ncbi:unnamed protein product [Dovyalis caffra]|uniref:CW-type domain-containing protein n=1 Tax=Dovyalis caffra TaxID=77055 RepID=A0AAV1SWW2_9ROSI|nr:unnamed protein product [Dovyalis caffra]